MKRYAILIVVIVLALAALACGSTSSGSSGSSRTPLTPVTYSGSGDDVVDCSAIMGKGYTKVKLFQAGYPAWKEAYGAEQPAKAAAAGSGAGGAPKVETGDEEGIITIASFNNLMKNHMDDFYWYDVRDPEEVEADGTYDKAVVMAVDEVEDRIDELPSDKPIIFFCSTGARSGEAYDLVKMKRESLKVYFLDANVEFHKDGSMPTASPPD